MHLFELLRNRSNLIKPLIFRFMKIKLLGLLVLTAITAPHQSIAIGLSEDNFTTSVGAPVTSLANISTTTNGNSIPTIAASNLSYPYLPDGGGNAAYIDAGASSFTLSYNPPDFSLNPSEYNNTWFSLLVNVSATGSLSTSGENIVDLVQNGTSIAGFALRDNGAGMINVGATRSGASTQWNLGSLSYGTTFLLVGDYAWEAPFGRPGGLHAEAFSSAIDAAGNVGPEVFQSDNGTNGVGLYEFWTYSSQNSLQPNGIMINSSSSTPITVDAIRIGTLGGDVTPVPEPSTYALLGLGCLALCAAGFHKRTA